MLNIDWGIIGHKQQVAQLKKECEATQLSHAYLFSGVRNLGKTTLSLKLAAQMQAKDSNEFAKIYRKIKTGVYSDVIYLPDNGESIKISEIRELNQRVSMTSTGDYFFVIIQNADRMVTEAQNAFLKTLEEPHAKVIFILTTNRLDRLLTTILSRVRHYPFSPLSNEEMQQVFFKNSVPVKDSMLMQAHGRPGLLQRWLDQPDLYADWQQTYQQISRFHKGGSVHEKVAYVEEISKDTSKIDNLIEVYYFYIHEKIAQGVLGGGDSCYRNLIKPFDVLQKTRYFIESNVNKKLALENLLIQVEK